MHRHTPNTVLTQILPLSSSLIYIHTCEHKHTISSSHALNGRFTLTLTMSSTRRILSHTQTDWHWRCAHTDLFHVHAALDMHASSHAHAHWWHLPTYTLPGVCVDLTYTLVLKNLQKPPLTHTRAHTRKAFFLWCSIRLSMALILISRKGKSLLGAVGAGGKSSLFCVTHSNTGCH